VHLEASSKPAIHNLIHEFLINMAFIMACPNFKKGLRMAFGLLGVKWLDLINVYNFFSCQNYSSVVMLYIIGQWKINHTLYQYGFIFFWHLTSLFKWIVKNAFKSSMVIIFLLWDTHSCVGLQTPWTSLAMLERSRSMHKKQSGSSAF
jgi:hypothetical protein